VPLLLLLLLQLLVEYLDSHDAAEASRCLRGLAVPFFHHELVKQGLHAAMENAGQTDAIMGLFKRWVRSSIREHHASCDMGCNCC
jgi:hypothetical protein